MLLKGWELSVFTTYRSALTKSGYDLNAVHVDDTPVKNLLLAPFELQNISDPWVWGAALFGSFLAVLESSDQDKKFSDIERINILGDDANRAWGTGIYTANAFAISLGAGVGEEALWRGVLQNQLENRYGEDNGLWAASALFGSAHLAGIDGSANVEGALFATAGGYYLGSLYQRSGYQLAKPIAAHFWFDFAAIVTAFLTDPENNPFEVDVSYEF
jgi:membrane protease YdiL (CAAX protease family)